MDAMDGFGLRHLINILYREDDLKERTCLVFRWVKEKDLTQEQFDKLIDCCNEESVKNDKARRYGNKGNENSIIHKDLIKGENYWVFLDGKWKPAMVYAPFKPEELYFRFLNGMHMPCEDVNFKNFYQMETFDPQK